MQTVFQLLTRNESQNASIFFDNFVKKHTKLSKFPFDGLPLMNLAYFLLAAIKMKNQKTYFVLLQNYAPLLHSPDPSYIHYMRKIGNCSHFVDTCISRWSSKKDLTIKDYRCWLFLTNRLVMYQNTIMWLSKLLYWTNAGIMYFGVKPKTQPKKQGGLMGMIQNMMSELGAPDDSDEGYL